MLVPELDDPGSHRWWPLFAPAGSRTVRWRTWPARSHQATGMIAGQLDVGMAEAFADQELEPPRPVLRDRARGVVPVLHLTRRPLGCHQPARPSSNVPAWLAMYRG